MAKQQEKLSEKRRRLIKVGLSKVGEHLSNSVLYKSEQNVVRGEALRAVASDRQGQGFGDSVPDSLDIINISATTKQTACSNPLFLNLRCVHGHHTGMAIRCRKCVGCMHAWRSKVRHFILDGTGQGSKSFFVSLTLRGKDLVITGDKFDFIQAMWHKMLKNANKAGITFEYFKVVELQKRDVPHLHLVVNRLKVVELKDGVKIVRKVDDTQEVRAIMNRERKKAGFGYAGWRKKDKRQAFQVARLDGKGCASYLSKYLTKEAWEGLKRGDRAIRRYSRSKGWRLCDVQERVWRFSRIGRVTTDEIVAKALPCVCGERLTLNQAEQAKRWLLVVRDAQSWVAPLDLFDWLHGIR